MRRSNSHNLILFKCNLGMECYPPVNNLWATRTSDTKWPLGQRQAQALARQRPEAALGDWEVFLLLQYSTNQGAILFTSLGHCVSFMVPLLSSWRFCSPNCGGTW